MFAVKPYYLSSSGTLDYKEGYTIGRPSSDRFTCEVPLGSSIESTMEWCNRVGTKHSWVELNDPIYDVSGFQWLHHDGKRDLKRVVPNADAPYQIDGDCTLGSGFYNRYREIVKFMGDNTLQNWTTSGNCWSNMWNDSTWTNIQNLNTKPKLEKAHYHEYIYKGIRTSPSFPGGLFYKSISVDRYTPGSETTDGMPTVSGWTIPYANYDTAISNVSGLWHNDGYEFEGIGPLTFQFLGSNFPLSHAIAAQAAYLRDLNNGNTNTYSQLVMSSALVAIAGGGIESYPSGLPAAILQEIVNDYNLCGFSEFKYAYKVRKDYYGAVSGTTGSVYSHYKAHLGINLQNSFLAGFYNYDYNINNTEFPSYVNRKLKHILGIDNSDLYSSISGYWSDSYEPYSANYYVSGFTYNLLHTDYLGCANSWESNFKVGFGFINTSGMNTLSDFSLYGDTVARKIRDSDYIAIASFSVSEPSVSSHLSYRVDDFGDFGYRQIVGNLADLTWTNTLYDEWSNGNNLMFIAIWSEPFEGGTIDYSSLNPSVTDISIPSIPAGTYLPFEFLVGGTASDSIQTSKRGQLVKVVNRLSTSSGIPVGHYSSQTQYDFSRILSNNEWW